MDIKIVIEKNRDAWNEALPYHQKARKDSLKEGFKNSEFTTLNRDCDKYILPYINNINLKGKTIAHLPCNNGRELLSLLKFGAIEAVGFDISDVAISEAIELNEISKQNAKFIRTNILEIEPKYYNMFDFVYISEGSLQWFPELDDYFKIVSNLLKVGGQILIYEIHPFAYFFEQINSSNKEITLDDFISYFIKGPYSYDSGLDYIGQRSYSAKPCCWFFHKISDVINSIMKNNIKIIDFKELNVEMADNLSIKHLKKFPLSYILNGKKE